MFHQSFCCICTRFIPCCRWTCNSSLSRVAPTLKTMSRPPTPSRTLPTTQKEWRFEDTGYPSEWAEEYRPGGFQPIEIDDEFDQGRYRVIRKLGYGSYSTVWLAHDKQSASFSTQNDHLNGTGPADLIQGFEICCPQDDESKGFASTQHGDIYLQSPGRKGKG